MPETFLLDNTVVSNFAQVQRFDVLKAVIGGHVCLTVPVHDETRAGVAEGKVPGHVVGRALDEGWLRIESVAEGNEQVAFDRLLAVLDRGEASCLAVAEARGWAVATDDRKARSVAEQLGVPCTGTLGLLVVAIDRNVIDLATGNALLQRMIGLGYRSPVRNLDGYFE